MHPRAEAISDEKRLSILAVALRAPPQNTPESLQVGKYLSVLGTRHAVTLLTTRSHGEGWKPHDESVGTLNVRERIEVAVPEERLVAATLRRTALPLPEPECTWILRAPWVARRLSRPDCIYSRATPHSSSLMGYALARWFAVPWVMHLSDPWTDNPLTPDHGARLSVSRKLERRCFDAATAITVTSEQTAQLYRNKYRYHAHKIHCFPNVYEAAEINLAPVDFDQPFTLVHTGRLYGPRSPATLLRAIDAFFRLRPAAMERSRFLFAGFAAPEIERLFESAVPQVQYLGALSLERATELQRSAHVLVAIDSTADIPGCELFFPSKVLDYMAARRRVIALTGPNSETRRFVENGIGRAFLHDEVERIAEHIAELWDAYLARKQDVLQPGAANPEYSAEHQGQRLAALMGRL